MDMQEEYITAEKKVALQAELAELTTSKRREVLDALEFAKSLGDLSENAEYHQAREEQAKLEDRIKKVENILKTSIVVNSHHSTKVEVGSTVVVKKEDDKEKKKYQIVGSSRADAHTYSWQRARATPYRWQKRAAER
jgi:transcription elongation factor GreA